MLFTVIIDYGRSKESYSKVFYTLVQELVVPIAPVLNTVLVLL